MAHSVSLLGREVDCETIGGYKFLFSPQDAAAFGCMLFGVGGIGPEIPITQERKAKKRIDSGNAMPKFGIYPYLCKKKN